MNTPHTKGWREEFDEKFDVTLDGVIPFSEQYSADDFKSFIDEQIALARTDEAVRCEEHTKTATSHQMEEVLAVIENVPVRHQRNNEDLRSAEVGGYMNCKSDILSVLRTKLTRIKEVV